MFLAMNNTLCFKSALPLEVNVYKFLVDDQMITKISMMILNWKTHFGLYKNISALRG